MNMEKNETNFSPWILVGENFWNLRSSLKFLFGALDIGTQMSLIRLNSGKFLVIDTCDLTSEAKKALDNLTNNGDLIEAVIATHPFHTLYFTKFYQMYPNTDFYGTPRHLKKFKEIPWKGDVSKQEVQSLWENESMLYMFNFMYRCRKMIRYIYFSFYANT